MSGAATHTPASAPGETLWAVRPARTEDAPAVAAAVEELLVELGGSPPAHAALEAEARAHIEDPSLGLVLVAEAPPAARSHFSGTVQDNRERGGEPTGGGEPDPQAEGDEAAGEQAEGKDAEGDDSEGDRAEGDPDRGAAGELAGVLTASWARAIQVAGRLLTIEVLWTRREWRDRGVGAGLVDALAAAAAAEGVTRVEVGLPREGFPALRATERFYLANGFERLGPRMRRTVA